MKRYAPTTTIPPFGREGERKYFFKATQKTQVYDAIVRAGKEGITRTEIAKIVGLAADRISFYLSELRRAGYISVVGDPTTVSPHMNAEEAAFAAMLGLENALVAKVREQGSTQEMEKAFVIYSKTKERALAQPSPTSSPAQIAAQKAEAQIALRMAIISLVKMVF